MPFFTEKSGRDPLFLSYVGYYYIEKIFPRGRELPRADRHPTQFRNSVHEKLNETVDATL